MDLNVKIIQETFELVKPRAEEFATTFYQTLFADYPAAQELFASTSLEKQKRLLVASLVQVVHNIENPEFLGEYLGKMGERHFDYGVEEEHFDWVGLSLLKTLQSMFGKAWTAEYNRQWALAFDVIAALMREGLKRRRPRDVPEQKEQNVLPLRKVEPVVAPPVQVRISIELPRELTERLDTLAKQLVQQCVQEYFDQAVQRELADSAKRGPQDFLRKVS